MQPKVRIWIDARNEKRIDGELKELVYAIDNIQDKELPRLIYETLGGFVNELAVTGNKLLITYKTDRVSPTFIDYALKRKGINFIRE